MFRDAWLVTKKDLLIELRSRILINQIAPYTLLILVLFGFSKQIILDSSISLSPYKGLLVESCLLALLIFFKIIFTKTI